MLLPTLDCHAHIAATVTESQIRALGDTVVFAMAREPSETASAAAGRSENIVWGCGAHPAYIASGGDFDIEQFSRRSSQYAVIGEIGLDRRSGNLARQEAVLDSILRRLRDVPALFSIHCSGCSEELIALLRTHRPKGVIVHWFTGHSKDVDRFLSLGCYFSVNSAMRQDIIGSIPFDRVLTETDFPTARNRTGRQPGDTAQVESMLSTIHGVEPSRVRYQVFRNLRTISLETGAIDRMTPYVSDLLLAV